MELLEQLKAFTPSEGSWAEHLIETIHDNRSDKTIEEEEVDSLCKQLREIITKDKSKIEQKCDSTKSDKYKKLTSGKCARPDESDIKRVVKYAHDKLDPRHSTEKEFENLKFNLLIAGELELASQQGISPQERQARLSIAETLCYHKNYLPDEVLREGYDITLKRVECGAQDWDEVIGEHLHEFLHYKANLIMRSMLQSDGDSTPFKFVENRKQAGKTPLMENIKSNKDQVIYCNAYNMENCRFQDHHEGKFSGQNVTKWHICKKCWSIDNVHKLHRENSEECPRK